MDEKGREEKLEAREIQTGGRFWLWLDNFWYHHKWKVIITAFFSVIIIVAAFQLASANKADAYIMYAGPSPIADSAVAAFEDSFAAVADDYNGDGKTIVSFASLWIMSGEQVNAEYEKAQESGEDVLIFGNVIAENLSTFDNEIMSGDTGICLVDPYLYERVADGGGWEKLSVALGYTPEGAADEYSIRLRDTDFGRHFAGVSGLPEDTLLCIRTLTSFSFLYGKKSAEQAHERDRQMLKDIMEFKLK